MSPLALAWRSASREPARLVLGVAGVAAIGALLFNMLLLSRGLLVSFGDLLESVGFDVRVTATEALPTMGPPLEGAAAIVESIRKLPEVEDAIPVRIGRASLPGGGGGPSPDGSAIPGGGGREPSPGGGALPGGGGKEPSPDGGALPGGAEGGAVARRHTDPLRITLIGSGDREGGRRAWTAIRGSGLVETPAGEEPRILVNRNVAADLALVPGSRLRLSLETPGLATALPPVAFRVAGIIDFAFASRQERLAVISFGAFQAASGGVGGDEADLLLIASRPEAGPAAAVASIRRLRPDLHVFSNEQILARFSATDLSYFQQISFVLSSVTFFFAFLLVATLLTVTVNQRLGEIAALRAIGFSRSRVAADLLAESALLAGVGALASLPLGAALSILLDGILRQMPWVSERMHFFVFEPRTVFLHIGLLALAGLASAVYPIVIAVRLPIAGTLRREIVS